VSPRCGDVAPDRVTTCNLAPDHYPLLHVGPSKNPLVIQAAVEGYSAPFVYWTHGSRKG